MYWPIRASRRTRRRIFRRRSVRAPAQRRRIATADADRIRTRPRLLEFRRISNKNMKRFGFIFLTTIALAGSAWGDSAPRFDTGPLDNGQTTTNVKPKILDNVGIDQKLDSQLPMDAVFTDETGHMGKLSEFFHGRPVLLSLVQFDCQKLCTLELNGLCRAANGVALQPGKDYDILTVSFDPRETSQFAALKKRTYESQINRDGVSGAWHFLTG